MSLSCVVCGGCARSPQSVLANMTELWSPWLHHILHYYMLAASKDIALYSCNTFTVCKLFHMFDSYEDWICCKLMLGGCYGVCQHFKVLTVCCNSDSNPTFSFKKKPFIAVGDTHTNTHIYCHFASQ